MGISPVQIGVAQNFDTFNEPRRHANRINYGPVRNADAVSSKTKAMHRKFALDSSPSKLRFVDFRKGPGS
jgi:hypothetical protein